MIWIHRGLLFLAFAAMALALMYAVRALTGKPYRARRAARASIPVFVFLVADALGRIPVTLRAAEASGSGWIMAWTTADVLFKSVLPTALWGLALLGRWRGWLADIIFAWSVVIAAGLTVVFYLLPTRA